MTRLKTFGSHCLPAAGLLIAVSAAQADTLVHPYCDGSAGTQADRCTELKVRYIDYYEGRYYHEKLSSVKAVIGQDCQVATDQGTVTIAVSKESELVAPGERKLPVSLNFVFPSGCAVKLHAKTGALAYWLDVHARQNAGDRVFVVVNMDTGDIEVSPPQ